MRLQGAALHVPPFFSSPCFFFRLFFVLAVAAGTQVSIMPGGHSGTAGPGIGFAPIRSFLLLLAPHGNESETKRFCAPRAALVIDVLVCKKSCP